MPAALVTIELKAEDPAIATDVGGIIAGVSHLSAAEIPASAILQNEHKPVAVSHSGDPEFGATDHVDINQIYLKF